MSKDPDRKMGMASITKVMTAMVALDSGIDLDKPCNIVSVDLERVPYCKLFNERTPNAQRAPSGTVGALSQ